MESFFSFTFFFTVIFLLIYLLLLYIFFHYLNYQFNERLKLFYPTIAFLCQNFCLDNKSSILLPRNKNFSDCFIFLL
jgi:hypothetical protein